MNTFLAAGGEVFGKPIFAAVHGASACLKAAAAWGLTDELPLPDDAVEIDAVELDAFELV
jgi:hypothetical protein